MDDRLPFTITIKRFKPIEVLAFNPDKPLEYCEPFAKQNVANMNDVARLGKELYDAELKAWEGQHSKELVETIIDGAIHDLMDVGRYLETIRSDEAKEAHRKIMDLIVRMKCPIVSCVMQSLESIYLKGGLKAVRETVERLCSKRQEEA